MHTLSELIAEVSRYKRVNLGEREIQFLSRIGWGDNSSYKIFSRLKKMGQPMDYKNVNKRVRRLHELGLITKAKAKGESIHNAKFYALTSEGLFYLLAGGWTVDKSWLREYKDNIILRHLLEPYFEENTIAFYGIDYEISKYLQECCQMILSCVDAIKSIAKDYSQRKKAEEMIVKQLQIDLEWQAKTLAFKLVSKKTDFWDVFNAVRTGTMLTTATTATKQGQQEQQQQVPTEDLSVTNRYASLANDKKFIKFSKNLGKEYEQAFSKLDETAQKFDRFSRDVQLQQLQQQPQQLSTLQIKSEKEKGEREKIQKQKYIDKLTDILEDFILSPKFMRIIKFPATKEILEQAIKNKKYGDIKFEEIKKSLELLTDKKYENINELKKEITKIRNVNVHRPLNEQNIKVNDTVRVSKNE